MSINVNIYYTGENGNARKFINDMINEGIVDEIRAEPGNVKYDYFIPVDDEETVLLIDAWKDQKALDDHHASEMMSKISKLRDKYDLKMRAERYKSDDEGFSEEDKKFIKN